MNTMCAHCGSLNGGHTLACQSIHSDSEKPAQVPVPNTIAAQQSGPNYREQLRLWFFRDLTDDLRKKLYSLCGLPVPELKTLGVQRHAFDLIFPSASQLRAAGGKGYDRDLIADMLDGLNCDTCAWSPEAIGEQARLLREADNRDAAGVHTAKLTPAGGFVVVPREPTEAMIDAFMDEEIRQSRLPKPLQSPRADIYRAMIAAAPAVQSSEVAAQQYQSVHNAGEKHGRIMAELEAAHAAQPSAKDGARE